MSYFKATMHQIQFRLGSAPGPALRELRGKGRGGRTGSGGEGRVFSLYLSIHGLQKGPGKFFMESWKVLEKSLIFVSKRVGTLQVNSVLSTQF